MSNNFIWPIDRTLSGATNPGQSGPETDGNEGIFHIVQSSSITRASDCHIQDTHWGSLVSLQRCRQCILQHQPTVPPGHSLGES